MSTDPITLQEVTFDGDNAGQVEILAGDLYQSWVPSLDLVELRSPARGGVQLRRGDRLVLSVVSHGEDE